MRKAILALLLLCMLPLACAPPARAEKSAMLFQSGVSAPIFPFEAEGALYALANGRLYALDGNAAGEAIPVALEGELDLERAWLEFLAPVRLNGALYLLGRVGGNEGGAAYVAYGGLFSLKIADGTATAALQTRLDWDGIGADPRFSPALSCVFAQENTIYALLTDDAAQTRIAAFDAEEGSCTITAIDGLSCIAPYYGQEGMLAALRSGELGQISYRDMRYAPLGAFPADAAGLFYDAPSGALYFYSEGALHSAPDMRLDAIETLSPLPLGTQIAALPSVTESHYILADQRQVWQAPLRAVAQEARKLVVEDRFDAPSDRAFYAFQAAHPGVVVERANDDATALSDMLNQSPETDVYLVKLIGPEYLPLFERGYMASLAPSETLAAHIAAMYPAMQEWLVREGEPVGMPLACDSMSLFGLNPEAFAQIGLTPQEYPQTWPELYALLERLPGLLADAAGEITLFDGFTRAEFLRERLFLFMVESYLIQQRANGAPLRLDTPQFREMLSAYEAVDWDALQPFLAPAASSTLVLPQVSALFQLWHDIGVTEGDYDAHFVPHPLGNAAGDAPVISMQMSIAFVNPYSQEPELAMEYIEALAAELDEAFWIMTQPEQNTPVLNRTFELDMQRYDEAIASYTEQLERQSDAQRAAELEARLAEAQREKAEYEQTRKYSISPQSIAAYRESAQRMQFAPHTALTGNDPAGQAQSEIVQQYVQGLLSGEAFIATMDERFAMMELEGQ